MSIKGTSINIICLESDAFHALVNEVVDRITKEQNISNQQWINDQEAMTLLHISSKSTLQRFRDEGLIRFSQPSKKLILYDRNSILELLEKNANDTY